MSKYTTGEIAKLCGVSVRTVQYYDTRNILTPSELKENGIFKYCRKEEGNNKWLK
ncbi:MAG: MerR family DNA-binding transcriptional regulator [Anaerovoracaceae bacterium]|uniref:MerR family DNA-binding transcriptional regulator n=1 Tax=Anaerofustis butyriciformans TaxID=3108533 RepID=UPI002E35BDA3|nr:MerR family DNA-binding transcriptional regulator [Anaerofustis sp. HA2171]